ncbi:hypothetical protein DFH28DRAFT_881036, partial [Melampsora americana]
EENETKSLEKREEIDQNMGPFPMLGGPDKAGKVFTVTGSRETQSDNVLVQPNRLSLSFIDTQPKLKRRSERMKTRDEIVQVGEEGIISDASAQQALNLLPTSEGSTGVYSIEVNENLISSKKTEDTI